MLSVNVRFVRAGSGMPLICWHGGWLTAMAGAVGLLLQGCSEAAASYGEAALRLLLFYCLLRGCSEATVRRLRGCFEAAMSPLQTERGFSILREPITDRTPFGRQTLVAIILRREFLTRAILK